jgi:glycosyltransferase involved in cell wall biosynthesis
MIKISIIIPTEAKLEDSEKVGLLSRWKFYFSELSKHFNLEVFSCDKKNYSEILGVKHITLPLSLKFIPYGNQILYNFWLLFNFFRISKMIRVISVSYFVLPLLKLLNKKIILSYHYDYRTTTEKDFGGIKGLTAGLREYLSIKSAYLVIVTTEELKRKVKNIYHKDSVVIPNFVDISRFKPMQKENYILYAGRIYWHKGIDYLLEAFAEVEKSFDIRLKLAGIGDIDFYKDKLKKIGIKNVEFLGSVDNSKMPDLMGKAKIFVLPTVIREGHPKALIEAMACGCACIATDVPGNNELIQNGKNGLLVMPKDRESLLKALVKVLSNESLRITLSENARKTAEKFSVENTLYKEIGLIKKILEKTSNV